MMRAFLAATAQSKLLPKVYGDRMVTELGNAAGDDGRPIPLAMEVVDKTAAALAVLRVKLGTTPKD